MPTIRKLWSTRLRSSFVTTNFTRSPGVNRSVGFVPLNV